MSVRTQANGAWQADRAGVGDGHAIDKQQSMGIGEPSRHRVDGTIDLLRVGRVAAVHLVVVEHSRTLEDDRQLAVPPRRADSYGLEGFVLYQRWRRIPLQQRTQSAVGERYACRLDPPHEPCRRRIGLE